DEQSRLTRESWAGHRMEYSYDPVGNRTRVISVVKGRLKRTIYVYDELNRLVTVRNGRQRSQLEYDLNGNLVRKRVGARNPISYSWDTSNRLLGVDNTSWTIHQ